MILVINIGWMVLIGLGLLVVQVFINNYRDEHSGPDKGDPIEKTRKPKKMGEEV